MKKFIPFIIAFLIIFYVLPLPFASDTLVLVITPILLLIASIIFGGFYGFDILLSVCCFLCAIPLMLTSGLIFLVYVFGFFIVSILGNLLGLIFRNKKI